MIINRSIDVEEAIRVSLGEYMQTYVKPLPANFTVPSVEITAVGGSEMDTIDTFDVTLDSRAEHEAEAYENLPFCRQGRIIKKGRVHYEIR